MSIIHTNIVQCKDHTIHHAPYSKFPTETETLKN
jgi:hypothetical protein